MSGWPPDRRPLSGTPPGATRRRRTAPGARAAPLLAALATVAIAPPPAARAQAPGEVDAGTLEIREGGRRVASETFAVRRQGGRLVAVGRVSAEGAGGPSFEVGLEVDAELHPLRYELRPVAGSLPAVAVTRSGGRLRVVTRGAEGERLREFLASDDLLLVERGVAHHHGLIARSALRIPGEPPRRVGDALSPLDGARVPIVLRASAETTLNVGGTERPARRLELSFGEETRIVWLASSGELLRVEIPSRGWTATRTGGRTGTR